MILIGQYDSPFVRRVAIAMRRYGIAYEHLAWSVFRDAEQIARYNPLRRVPTLVLDDGVVLVESSVILETLDDMDGPERALLPRTGPERREGLRIMAFATGVADKGVSLYLERLLRKAPSERWTARCREQIADTLDVLEADRARRTSSWWLGDGLGHVDITVACMLGFLREAHPDLFSARRWPRLAEHSTKADELAEFREVYLPFVVHLGD